MDVTEVPTSDLATMAAPYNPRQISDHDLDALRRSLRYFGTVEPIVVNKRSGRIVGGHQRVKAAQAESMVSMPVVYVDLDDPSEKQLNLALNRIHGDWEPELLGQLLRELEAEGADLALTGFAEDELAAMLEEASAELTAPDEVPEIQENAITRAGDLIVMGSHRLLCGDSTDERSVSQVLGRERAVLCLTDPPYGIGEEYESHDDTEANLDLLISGFFPIAKSKSDRILLTPSNKNQRRYPKPDWTLCWFVAAGVGLGPWGFTCWQPILAYGTDPFLANGLGSRPDALSLMEAADNSLGHPCSKPVGVWTWILERGSLNKGDVIFDPFGGSGTGLIACEITGRSWRGVEIEPRYCDVIVKRWQDFTGKKAEGWRGNA